MRLPSVDLESRLLGLVLASTVLLAACTEASTRNTAPAAFTPTPTSAAPATHVVVRGETLSTIARDTGVELRTLVELNDIQTPDLIEPGLVLLLETAPEPAPAPPPRATTATTDPVQTWIEARWGDVRPHLTLSQRSIEQGAIAGLLLPAVVTAMIATWLLFDGARALVAGAVRRATSSRAAGDERADAPTSGTEGPSERGRGLPHPSAALRAQVHRLPMEWPSRVTSSAGVRTKRLVVGIALGAWRRTRNASQLLRERWRDGLNARAERRLQEEQFARQAALRDQWWRPGMEALRIGLLADANRCFEAGLAAAEAEHWHEEIALFEESLQRLRERRSDAVTVSSRT
jgi:LysM repeat protein